MGRPLALARRPAFQQGCVEDDALSRIGRWLRRSKWFYKPQRWLYHKNLIIMPKKGQFAVDTSMKKTPIIMPFFQ